MDTNNTIQELKEQLKDAKIANQTLEMIYTIKLFGIIIVYLFIFSAIIVCKN